MSLVKPSVKFFTLGCKANQYDTQEIRERFLESGLRECENSAPADIYVINTCTVTARADKDSLYYLHRSHRENPRAKIIVTGCLTELDSARFLRQPGVHLIVKNRDKARIVELLSRVSSQTKLTRLTNPTNKGISFFRGHTRVFLKIQDGCDNFCAYCKVPLVRGRSRSKPLEEILQEARNLVKNGFREIVLTGICLGAFGQDLKPKKDLVDVIDGLEKIPDLWRIRLSSIEAGDISQRLIRKLSHSKKLCHHLHIPIQSGDDEILQKMHRHYRSKDYLRLIRKIKSAVAGIAITTDVLVGFPGEKKPHFLNTVKLVKKILPLRVHIFPYSPREHTAAYGFKDKVDRPELESRILSLRKVVEECTEIYQRRWLKRRVDVLIETKVKEKPGFWEGYTDNYLRVRVKSVKRISNEIIRVKVRGIERDYLIGDIA